LPGHRSDLHHGAWALLTHIPAGCQQHNLCVVSSTAILTRFCAVAGCAGNLCDSQHELSSGLPAACAPHSRNLLPHAGQDGAAACSFPGGWPSQLGSRPVWAKCCSRGRAGQPWPSKRTSCYGQAADSATGARCVFVRMFIHTGLIMVVLQILPHDIPVRSSRMQQPVLGL
jgi:hypothetical protein